MGPSSSPPQFSGAPVHSSGSYCERYSSLRNHRAAPYPSHYPHRSTTTSKCTLLSTKMYRICTQKVILIWYSLLPNLFLFICELTLESHLVFNYSLLLFLDNYMDNSSGNLTSHDSWSALNSSGMGTLAHTTNTTSNTRYFLSHFLWSLFFKLNIRFCWLLTLLTLYVMCLSTASTQACGLLRGQHSPPLDQRLGPSQAGWHLSFYVALRCPTPGWLPLCPCPLPPLCTILVWVRLELEMPSSRALSPGSQPLGHLWHKATEIQTNHLFNLYCL